MNTPTIPPSPPDLELIRKAMREYQPNPHRVPFTNLKPFHDSIVELRGKNASYAAIADLLKQHGVNTSRARVAEYGRIVLEGGKQRKRRKHTTVTLAANIPATPQSAPALATMAAPAIATTSAFTPPAGNTPRGPRIAKIELLPGSELKP
jgi:hypothetical protein